MISRLGISSRRSATIWLAALVGLVTVFALHGAMYGAWLIDDAGISMAYALNVADGHGLVAQPGADRVEGFSNPSWVLLLAAFASVRLLGRGDLLGVPDYLVVSKGLAVVFHATILVSLALIIRRVLGAVLRRPPSELVVGGCWLATGLVLAANPSYVIWMIGGLENPLLAATVAAMTATAVGAVLAPTRRSFAVTGALGGLAAITRPDGVVYSGVLLVVVVAMSGTIDRRWSLAWPGLVAFAAPVLGYLSFRLAYFGAWLPNTAVAKSQDVPVFDDLLRVEEIGTAFGLPLVVIGSFGVVVSIVAMSRERNIDGLRAVAVGLSAVAAGGAAFVVLQPDWMPEFRFLTPLWPLLSCLTVLGVAELASFASRPVPRAVVVGVIALIAVPSMLAWQDRAQAFRASPTVPLCRVAELFGHHFNSAAERFGLDPDDTTLLIADLGGTLLVSDLRIVDLAGLMDVEIAQLLRDESYDEIASYIIDDVQPSLVRVQGWWVGVSGLGSDPRFEQDYLEYSPTRYVRRDLVAGVDDVAEIVETLEADDRVAAARSRRAPCGPLLVGS